MADNTQNAEKGSGAFVAQVARYYRDFLETDFKKSRAPARQVRIRDESGSPLGFNVRRYPALLTTLAEVLKSPFTGEVTVPVKRGQYTQRISRNLQLLLTAQIDALDERHLRDQLKDCVHTLKNRSEAGKSNIDKFVDDAQEFIAGRVVDGVVKPLIKTLEETLASNPSINAQELLYEIEDDIAEHIIDEIRENLPAALVEMVQNDNLHPIERLLNETVGPEALKDFLAEFLGSLATGDAYEELLGLAATMKIRESFQVYLYLMDLIVKTHQFPIAYIPMQLEKVGDSFRLILDNRLFFNRRALKYAVDSNPDAEMHVPGRPTNDRIHFLFKASPLSFVEDAILAMHDGYKLPDRIRPFSMEIERSRTNAVEVTNAIHICAFERGEEAIINDYEEILIQSAQEDSPLRALFDSLINGCILEEPRSIRGAVESAWEDTPREERLVYESPVPLNEEQRKLLLALQNESCRYAVVEGPPGTGKSHTITAIVFDAIMRDRSVLVLSDKEEALDVVEAKLTQTLNEIRPGDDFQNPILRLGRTSGTYTKILKKGAQSRINTYFQAAKTHRLKAQPKIRDKADQLKRDINKTVEQLSSIDIKEILQYERLVAELGLDDVESLGLTTELQLLLAGVIDDIEGLSERASVELVGLASDAEETNTGVEYLIKQRLLEGQISRQCSAALPSLQEFERIPVNQISWFITVVNELKEMRNPVFGYLFKNAETKALATQMTNRMRMVGLQPPHKRRKVLESAAQVLGAVKSKAERIQLDNDLLQHSIDRLRGGAVNTALEEPHATLIKSIVELEKKAEPIFLAIWQKPMGVRHFLEYRAATKEMLHKILSMISHHNSLATRFNGVPALDLQKTQAELQHEHTADLAHRLDKNVLDFITGHSALSTTLRALIQQRQPFPKERFEELKKAFPCIIAGIREFADYIPLAPGLVDIVIIDEASQVSIAQAFPALLRAKQVVVLGDEQQFANVKATNASRAINQEYMYELEEVFRANFSVDNEKMERMRNFDVRTSILRFFDLVKHFDVMLKKHFRGYSELISFSSKYFYDSQLQAIRIRAKPVSDVLQFSVLDEERMPAITHRNANEAECIYIHEMLESLLEIDEPPTVGVITPFREQQKLVSRSLLFESPLSDDFRERLNLKVMTFDTCQGEERDIIFYSLVATRSHDRLNYIFPTELQNWQDGVERIKAQRLNVGFSRARETIHFVMSKNLEEYKGTVREVLRHYRKELETSKALPSVEQVDANSPMEAQVLHWLRQTPFYQEYHDRLEVVPQFPIGDYLKQLDPFYVHPNYRVDFLLLYEDPGGKKVPVIIEYDGFREHFKSGHYIDESNYEYYYRDEDVERQFVLESYGYNFLRVNRFNLGKDPVATLSNRLMGLISTRVSREITSEHTEAVNKMVEDLESGNAKICKKCGKPKPMEQFKRTELKSGYGRYCNGCNGSSY